ncbi:MAG: hypothetical protein WD960_11860 [Gemmatimonadota bacterium]
MNDKRPTLASMTATAAALIFSLWLSPSGAAAQDAGRGGALRVFLDCNTFRCDSTYFRTEIDWVNWVRDRTLAQIHLIVTSTQTGGGGSVFTLEFIGQGDLDDDDDQLRLTTASTDTDDEVVRALTSTIAAGLARYSAAIGRPAVFEITGIAGSDGPDPARLAGTDQVDDPWNFWVFEVGGDFDIEGEETESERRYSASFEASRTTPMWKFEFEADGSQRRDERELGSGETIVDERTDWGTDVLLAYTLAEHWSLGFIAGAGASTSRNQRFGADAAAAIEYSFFPYEEAPRQSLTARYDLRVQHFEWEEETIYFKTAETRPQQRLRLELFQRQPWGESRLSLDASQFLHDLERWSVSLSGGLEFRILRGLNLDVRGGVAFIEDQLFISREGLTDEEILLGRFQRPTDFTYELSMGLSYEFGSIYNNVVNNRFTTRRFRGGFF